MESGGQPDRRRVDRLRRREAVDPQRRRRRREQLKEAVTDQRSRGGPQATEDERRGTGGDRQRELLGRPPRLRKGQGVPPGSETDGPHRRRPDRAPIEPELGTGWKRDRIERGGRHQRGEQKSREQHNLGVF